MAQTFNIMVFSLTTFLIYPFYFTQDSYWDTPYEIYDHVMFIIVHSVPVIFSSINIFFLNDAVIYMDDWWYILLFAAAYSLTSFLYTFLTD